ncbi:hypothetical protein F441_10345, partial [Phytophthora nicotianae CJ01A1]
FGSTRDEIWVDSDLIPAQQAEREEASGAQGTGQSTATPVSDTEVARPIESMAAPAVASTNVGVRVPVPAHVNQAIRDYVPLAGFTVVPKRRGERSIILDWGVRISATIDGKDYVGWI